MIERVLLQTEQRAGVVFVVFTKPLVTSAWRSLLTNNLLNVHSRQRVSTWSPTTCRCMAGRGTFAVSAHDGEARVKLW